ncbi:glycine-rich protein [Forsythia ovata]|uniref:Glycine-rich protein n=1 Tax=Forsythia ovata TaxID=205694 RepID=A0ABD1XBE3_9LAMI
MAVTTAASSSSAELTTDGPVLSLINKRLRSLRKKQNRILQMEESVSQGKILNKEQEETLKSKPIVLAAIDELEKLRQPLSEAVAQEISIAYKKMESEAPIKQTPDEETRKPEVLEPVPVEEEKSNSEGVSVISDLMNLLYFGSVFDVKTLMRAHDNMLTRTHERHCCLTYDYVTDDDATDPLKEWDLDLISMLGGMLLSRPVDSSLSHKNALQQCIEHAKQWLANSDQPIEPNSNVTYAGLREKLNKIMASDYFTTTPEMKGPVEVAAAAGNYTSFQVPVHGSVVPVQVEGSAAAYEQEAEESPSAHGNEVYDDQPDHVEEHNPAGGSEVENSAELQPQLEPATLDTEGEQISRDLESKDQQYAPRRSYQNYRGGRGGNGGGRRGYPNGRGGRGSGRGGYQNGRSQFYEQPSNYYPRNNHFRGRGGRGFNGSFGYHAGQAAHVEAES